MKFEEQFPSLKYRVCRRQIYDRLNDKLHGKNKYILKTDVINYCLDKEKVREVIVRIMKECGGIGADIESSSECEYMAASIMQELGLNNEI